MEVYAKTILSSALKMKPNNKDWSPAQNSKVQRYNDEER